MDLNASMGRMANKAKENVKTGVKSEVRENITDGMGVMIPGASIAGAKSAAHAPHVPRSPQGLAASVGGASAFQGATGTQGVEASGVKIPESEAPEGDFQWEEINVEVPEPDPIPDGVQETQSGDFKILTPIKNGKKNGTVKVFQNDRLSVEMTYVDDVLEGPLNMYYPNGKLQSQGINKSGELQGKYIIFYGDGKTQMTLNYENGKQHGESTTFDEDGEVVQKSKYKHGILHGDIMTYHEGEVINRQHFIDGVETKKDNTEMAA